MFYVREGHLSNSRERLTRAILRVSQQHEPASGQRLCSFDEATKTARLSSEPRSSSFSRLHVTTVSFVIAKMQLAIQGGEQFICGSAFST
jgi:hypothetical protein